MGLGLPVLATALGGTPEVVEDNKMDCFLILPKEAWYRVLSSWCMIPPYIAIRQQRDKGLYTTGSISQR
jgi:glycosyltransferase involved in cell wall biosynthesis